MCPDLCPDLCADLRLDLWWLDLATLTAADLASAFADLSAGEQARATAMTHAPARAAFTATRAALRRALSLRLAATHPQTPPAAWSILSGVHGKPALADPAPAVAFNVSHTDGAALVALVGPARAQEAAPAGLAVGVDVERAPERPRDAVAVGRRVFTEAERAWLAQDPEGRFLTLWTLKEAALKATGQGLAGASSLQVRPAEDISDGGAAVEALDVRRAPSAVGLRWRLRYATRSGGRLGKLAYAWAVCAHTPFTVQVRAHARGTLGL